MLQQIRRTARRAAPGLILAATVAALPQLATGQITRSDDPCYETLSAWGDLAILTQVSYTDTGRLADAFLAVRTWVAKTTGVLAMSKSMLSAGGSLTAEERAARQRLRDCIPWLREIIRRLDDAMKQSNINVIDPGGRDARGGMPRADAVAAVQKAVAEALAEAKAQLTRK